MKKLEQVCKDLQEQLGDEYVVLMPTNAWTCIGIFKHDYPYLADKLKECDYIDIRKV
jgi:hypothetical protein